MTPTPQPQEAVIPSEGAAYPVSGPSIKCKTCGRMAYATMSDQCCECVRDRPEWPNQKPEAPVSEAVAWRVHDWADGWILFDSEEIAGWECRDDTRTVQPLYAHPSPSPVSAWKPGREEIALTIFSEAAHRFMRPSECYPIADAILSLSPATEGAGE